MVNIIKFEKLKHIQSLVLVFAGKPIVWLTMIDLDVLPRKIWLDCSSLIGTRLGLEPEQR